MKMDSSTQIQGTKAPPSSPEQRL